MRQISWIGCVCTVVAINAAFFRDHNLDVDTSTRPRVLFEKAVIKGEDYLRPLGASQLAPLTSAVTCSSQQVHVSLGDSSDSVFITFASTNSSLGKIIIGESKEAVEAANVSSNDDDQDFSSAAFVSCESQAYSQLISIAYNLFDPAMGPVTESADYIVSLQNTSVWAYSMINGTKNEWGNYVYTDSDFPATGIGAYNNPYMFYDSPFIYTAVVSGLTPNTVYYYKPIDSCDEVFQFKLPYVASGDTSDYPMTMGVTVDLGQTLVSNASINALLALDPEFVILAGDLSYADGWYSRWDSFGNLIEPLASKIPILTTGGNHEFGGSEAWLSYSKRYPTPHKGAGSANFCYYGREVGVVHIIALCSYSGFTNSTLQYQWLTEYLSTSINRTKTPWLIAMMHVPFYNSNTGHWMEGELMRQSMESILYEYGVDLVIVGHVHVYERTYPVYDNELNECGPMHMTIGDGGNYEGTYVPWRTPQPDWSAFRESSFGVAGFEFVNSTTAYFSWHRHACQSDSGTGEYAHMSFNDSCVSPGDNGGYNMETSDIVTIIRPSESRCPNRYISTKTTSEATVTDDDLDDNDSNNEKTYSRGVVIGMLVVIVVLLLVIGILIYFLAKLHQRLKLPLSAMESSQSGNKSINVGVSSSSSS